ncbi:MAG TPA: Gfo/Idh/MocA family oxidoreductase [Geminicoccus sp.]|jgi:predicted dehydrogenase|uniref:Gfo/Idh/MocA family protein n=1 Tax=Geminicoccus sp. TaxID=2024832 RepID=UPI002E3201CA|nr:Gfo/Idh/MocA family oxidoreductase [Geminicoccus sp.]HEX2528308.1 Gfo/Idh/MocA family oxidoreductase [Geminicoccus sp.]
MATIRGALIGCGFFAQNQMHGWADIEGVDIVAICDRDRGRLDATGERFGIAKRYQDAGQMLAGEQLDFVDIATTAPTHRMLVEMAASRGLAVICQKPFALSMGDAEAMVRACEAAGPPLMVHENFRWQTPIQLVRAQIDKGLIGRPFFGRFSFRSGFDVFSGQPYLAQGQRFIIEDLGIHILDIARFIMGDATSLACRTMRINPRIKGEDVATMLLGHGDATSIVDCSYATRLAVEPFPQTLMEVDGDEGSIRLTEGYQLTVHGQGGTQVVDASPILLPWAQRPWHNIQESVRAIQQHWVDCLRSGREPQTSGRDDLKTLRLVEAAYESAGRGTVVDVRG